MSSSRRAIPKAWHPKRRIGQIGPLSVSVDLSQSIALGTAVVTVTPVALAVVTTDPPVILRPRVAWSPTPVASTRPRAPIYRARSRVIQLPAAQQADLTAATVTVTPVALGITTGGVSLALGTATVTVTPVAIDIAAVGGGFAPIITRPRVAWSNAGVTSTRGRPPVLRARSRTTLPSSPQSIALTAAVVTVTPVALTATPGGASLTLTATTVTVTPVALTATSGAATVALTAATVTVTPVALGTSAGGISLTLTATTITVTAVALTVTNVLAVPDTNPITLTLPERGHTATLEGARHTLTLRERAHTLTVQPEQAATLRGDYALTLQEHT